MSTLIPNLPGLIDRLADGTDARLIAEAFDADTVEAARTSLRNIIEDWESPSVEVGMAGPETPQ